MYIDTQLLELHLIPVDELTHAVLEVTGGYDAEGSAKNVTLVVQIDLATAFGGAAGGLQSAGAGTDYHDVRGPGHRRDNHMGLKAGVRIDSAGELSGAAEDAAYAFLGA